MKTKTILSIGYSICLVLMTSCSNEESSYLENDEIIANEIFNIKVEDDALSFDSEESLASFLRNENEKEVRNTLKDLALRGFSSLRPEFDSFEAPEVEEFLAAKASRIASKGKLYSTKTSGDEIDLDDEIISDNKFAKLLNVDRAVMVGNRYYIYTTDGLYFCKKEHKNKLEKYLKSLTDDKSFKPSSARIDDCAMQKKSSKGEEVLSLTPVTGKVTSVTSEISMYTTKCDGGGSTGGGSSGGSSGGTSSTTIPILIPQNFGSCAYTENSLFQQVFGNTVKCNDYHDSTHRIQTKVWNENYLIWSSVGASAKYQKKRLIGWSESSTSDGVRLGINHAVYTYKSPMSPYNAHDPKRVIFKYKGVNYDQYGNVVTTYPINASAWPFPQNETLGAIDIYIFGDDQYWPLTGKDANKTINQLLSQARGVIRGLSSDMTQEKVGVQVVKFLPTTFKVTQADVLLKHSSQAKKVFDFNFLLKFKSSTTGWFQNVVNQLNAEKYDKIEIDMYGAAIRNNVWKGKRVKGKVD